MIQSAGNGAAATGHRLTTQAALEVIEAGGNAFDGAIAAGFMACVCEPVLASPGGGGFAMVHKDDGTKLLDFFAQTPAVKKTTDIDFKPVEADFGTAKQIFHIGNASSATPGFIPGIFALHENHGSLPITTLIAPAQRAAWKGVEITHFQNFLSNVVAPILLHSAASRKIFAPQGKLPEIGAMFRNRQLADFFDQIGTQGKSAFPVDQILSEQKKSGHLQQQDFQNYEVVERQALAINISRSEVYLNPAPAAGGILVALALHHLGGSSPLDIALALKEVDKARRRSGNDLDLLLSGLGPAAYRGTTQISVVDRQKNACSMTLSNGEGNGHIVGDCGFMLNNMLGEADINPAGKLGWPQNARMSSMMCPTIVKHQNGSVLALGSGGSNRIRSAIFQVLVNLLVKGLSIGQSIEAPRCHVEDGHLDFEKMALDESINQLQAAFPDHRLWRQKNLFFGGCHIATVGTNDTFSGAGDPRRHGQFDQC